jgi:hypothetical protein
LLVGWFTVSLFRMTFPRFFGHLWSTLLAINAWNTTQRHGS